MVKYVLKHKDGKYFKYYNMYLSRAELADNINSALILSKTKAIDYLNCMSYRNDWEIWSVQKEFVLKNLYYKIDENKELLIKDLEKRLKELKNE